MKNIKYIFLIIGLALFLISCNEKFNIKKVEYIENKIKVMSYNIKTYLSKDVEEKNKHWDNRKLPIIKQIEEESADIVCLQEVKENQYLYLKTKLKSYKMIYLHRELSSFNREGLLVMYRNDRFNIESSNRFWLSDTPKKPSIGWDSYYERFCIKIGFIEKNINKKFYVLNTHLDYKSTDSQMKSLDAINKQLDNSTPTLILGDFNFKVDSIAYKYACNLFLDSRNDLSEQININTYNAFGNEKKSCVCDYIFLKNKGIMVKNYKVLNKVYDDIYASDHFPIISEMVFV